MRIVVFDSTAVSGEGSKPVNAAQFSAPTIKGLRAKGHTVVVTNQFDDELAAGADVVWTEWCHNEAFAAAASGACKKLVLRMRGFDVWNPLDKLKWENVHGLAYESVVLKRIAEERFPFLKDHPNEVIPAGIDTWRFPFGLRTPSKPVVAMLARAVADKGFQLAYEWMRRRTDLHLHIALALADLNPRLVRYLQETKPDNVTIHQDVDAPFFLSVVDPGYLLSASTWETLGYTIAEGMAMGIKPLIHEFPHARELWRPEHLWRSLDDLDRIQRSDEDYDSWSYRAFILNTLDAERCTERFEAFLVQDVRATASVPASTVPDVSTSTSRTVEDIGREIEHAINACDVVRAEQAINDLRARVGDTHREDVSYAMLNLAALCFNTDRFDEAEVWALRSLRGFPRIDAFALLGEIFLAQGEIDSAREWLEAAQGTYANLMAHTNSMQTLPGILDNVPTTLKIIADKYQTFKPVIGDPVPHVLVVQTCNEHRLRAVMYALDKAGLERWQGPKLIIADGFTPKQNTLPKGFMVAASPTQDGQAKTFFRGLQLASSSWPDIRYITFFEDDVVLAQNALDYIQRIDDSQFSLISWYTHTRALRTRRPMFLRISSSEFSRIPAITLRTPFVRRMLESDVVKQWTERHGADMVFAKFATPVAVHFPAIVDHVGEVSLTGNHGSRRAPTFVGTGFDASRFFDTRKR